MKQADADPSWYHALTLSERIASLRPPQDRTTATAIDVEKAGHRLQRWRSQSLFETGHRFGQRLALDGITEDELLYLLGEPIEALLDRIPTPPAWLLELDHVFSRSAQIDLPPASTEFSGQSAGSLMMVIEPLIRQIRARVREGLKALAASRNNLPFNPGQIEEMLFAGLPAHLFSIVGRTMVLELNVARLEGRLVGETPAERFQDFLSQLCQPEKAVALLREYPVLARQVKIRLDQWLNFNLEFLRNLCADWEELRETFAPAGNPGLLVEMRSGLGDTHRGGRSVLIAKFRSGFQIVYKPKSLAVDQHLQEILTWLNDHSRRPPFRTLKLLDRGSYGWVEFIESRECTSTSEIRRFYERLGGYLALLYALEATDFHSENLIAAGEHPVLIDLEALFHPRPAPVEGAAVAPSDLLTTTTMAYSVLRVGLLPQRIWGSAEAEGVDLSGLGGAAGQLMPHAAPYWEHAGTDQMHLARKRLPMPGSQNRPTLNGSEVSPLDYVDAVVTGFSSIYRLLLNRRAEFLSPAGPLSRFAGDEVRVIVRATRTYGMLLNESFHPDVLRNALDRDRLFDRLWAGVDRQPHLTRLIPAEREDLLRGDIPMFTTKTDSRDLWTSSNERIVDFFDEPGISRVEHQIGQLSEHDLKRQLWFVRASLATLSMVIDQAKWPRPQPVEAQHEASRDQLLAAARVVGDQLNSLALRGGREVNWIGLSLADERHWSLVPLSADLYNGLAGVALFLAQLGAVTGDSSYTELAEAALKTAQRQLERNKSMITGIGGFCGWGGIIYSLVQLAALWSRPELIGAAEEIVSMLPPLIEHDELLDVIGGAAGCLASLLVLYRYAPVSPTLAAAVLCGDRLINCAQPMAKGMGWRTQLAPAKALAGFSHGAAGIAWALLELAAVTGEERFREAAVAAIEYERSLFAPEAGNWPDLREHVAPEARSGQNVYMTAWCHGAAGIGMARLCSLPHLDDATVRSEIEVALQTTLARGFGGNHSLCHGDLGNLDLLLQAGMTLNEPQWADHVNRRAAAVIESIRQNGWLCGVPLGTETPGLMTGLAGIGYGLLRLSEPRRVPSVLTLSPPSPSE